jgi:pyruvate/2-oxoglutarate dehydrogenase complex dihydrolipoamide dehydrogenase (E3) component
MRLAEPCHQALLIELARHGVEVRTNSEVRLIDADCRQRTVEFETSQKRQSEGFEAVLLASGIEPEAGLLVRAGARMGSLGGVLVDSRGETSLPGVLAAGDGVELPSQKGGASRFVPLATTAARLGRVCGENAAGGSVRMPRTHANIAVRLFSQQVAAVGHPADWAQAESHTIEWPRRLGAAAPFGSPNSTFPRRRAGRATFLTEQRSGLLLGAQFVAPEAAALADLASLAMSQEQTLSDLLSLDTSYTPPLSSLWHPFYLAARQAERSLSGTPA